MTTEQTISLFAVFGLFPLGVGIGVYWCLPHVVRSWDLDFMGQRTSFLLLLDRYSGLFLNVQWLSAAAAGVLLWRGDRYGAALFAGALLYSLLFRGYLLWAYEQYLHRKYTHDGIVPLPPYPTERYALTLTLGISTFIFFVLGVVSAIEQWR